MGLDISGLKEKANKLHADAESIAKKALDDGRLMNAEEKESFQKQINESIEIRSQIQEIEKSNHLFEQLKEAHNPLNIGRGEKTVTAVNPQTAKLDAYRSYLVSGMDFLTASQRDELRSLTLAGTDGYTAPEIVTNKLITILRDMTNIRQAPVQIIPTPTGNPLPMVVVNDTGENNTAVVAEAEDVGLADDPVISRKVLGAHNVASGISKVSKQLLQDSYFNVEEYVGKKLIENISFKSNKLYTTGAGTTEPVGLVTGVYAISGRRVTLANGHTTALGVGANALAVAQDLINNLTSVKFKVAYHHRVKGKTGWMMTDQTFKHLSTYTDTNGRPLLAPSIAGLDIGIGYQLLDFPIFINNSMDELGAGKKPIIFGNFDKFIIRDVGAGIAIDRLNERYAEYGLVGFNGTFRTDSIVEDESAFAVCVQPAE